MFATVHEVLHADWQEFAHSLQFVSFIVSFITFLTITLICFINLPPNINSNEL